MLCTVADVGMASTINEYIIWAIDSYVWKAKEKMVQFSSRAI